MKKRYLFLTLFFLCYNVYSQGEANIWYFGYNAGLDFSTGNPIALNNSQQQTVEGSATISDAGGQLLFYTDGNFVWNKNHEIMSNGTGLLGNPSSTQSAVIIPKPNSISIYYIITVTLLGGNNGVRYTEVDMNLNGGLGDVTSNKNILLLSPATEKISAVKQNNCEDFWVVIHKYGNNSFYAYSITSTGINLTPVISSVGTTISNVPNRTIGYLKFSPDGKKLISSNYQQNVELYDFDNATGIISNPKIISTKFANYGVEFSPLGNVAYITTGEFFPLELYQYDLTSVNILSTETLIHSSTDVNHFFGALQLATNGKIYLSIDDLNTLSVINNPETLGLGCNLGLNTVSIGSGLSKLGLPQFIQSYFSVGINVNNICLGNTSSFSYTSNQAINSIIWDFGDGNTSTINNPTHTYAVAGSYTVRATISTNTGTVIKCKQLVVSSIPVASTINNQNICDNVNMNYDLSSNNAVIMGSQSQSLFGVSYFLTLNDAISHINILPTTYQLPIGTTTFYAKLYSLSNKNCNDIKNFTVNLNQKPTANKPSDIIKCESVPYDGIENFTLFSQNSSILNGLNSSNYTISYHLSQAEAISNSNSLPNNYQNIVQSQEIFVRLQSNSNSVCFDTTTFFIKVFKKPIINPINNISICDDSSNDDIEVFGFSNQATIVLGSQLQSEFAITFHLSFTDAQQGLNEIQINYTNISNPQTIFVRIENILHPECNEISNFQLLVKSKPELNLNDIYAICVGSSITISAPTGYSNYLWSNGSTSSSTTINQEGNYSLTVFNDYGDVICENTKDFVVNNSNIATITNVEIEDLNIYGNSVFVTVTGQGDYEYSLDGYNYQESSSFLNVPGGEYTVFVRDKKGCGIAFENIFLMMYPKFFTPNNDGFNDYWRIKFSNLEPKIKTSIYDRYGKLIKLLNGNQDRWDGTFNGNQLPSTDYWFKVELENGNEYRGHFSLKR
jgi:gliding motility-associated-like protein